MLRFTAMTLLLVLTGCDSDGDGLSNAYEKEIGTDPSLADTDGDGLSDKEELEGGTDPLLADSDGDGLLDGEEEDVGTDPFEADSDGDGLSDGEEVAAGTDPNVVDTDGDGYTDFEEGVAGTDPLDVSSVIYQGGWPFNASKDDLGLPEWQIGAHVGEQVPRYRAVDQYGDVFDLYDLANQDRYIIISLVGDWNGWCHEVARWVDGEASAFDPLVEYEEIPTLIAEKQVYWVNILYAGDDPDTVATSQDVQEWMAEHRSVNVPLLLDDSWLFFYYMDATSYPAMMLVDPNMKIVAYETPFTKTWDALLSGMEG